MLEEADRERIAEAVNRAEGGTSAEIVCVLARQVSTYAETPIGWAAAAALVLPPVLLAAGVDPQALAASGWTAAHGSGGRAAFGAALGVYALAQAALFAVVAGLVAIPAVRLRLTPPAVKAGRVREAALGQLAAATLAAGTSRAAVVVFAADAEHRVEVLASEAAHAAVGQAVWDEAVAATLAGMKRKDPTEGLIAAVDICGRALAAHFPQAATDPNALPDRPLEL